jgi:hypothetical protein
MKTQKKNSKAHRMRRNAPAPARALPRAIVVRPRTRAATQNDAAEPVAESNGWRMAKTFGGALLATVLGAYIPRQDTIPPAVATGVLSGLGALVALEAPDKWKALGLGVMGAAGGQLGYLLIDDELIKRPDAKKQLSAAPSPGPTAPAKRQASDIPADALARAYERARLRMALTSDAPN